MVSSSEELNSDYFNNGPSSSTNNNLYEKGSYSSNTSESSNIVTSQAGKKYTIDFSWIRVMLNSLAPHGNVQITELKGELRKNFDNILEISKKVHTTAIYNKLFEQVKEVFYDEYPRPIPGTVAAFFIGCIVNTGDFKGPKGCDPRCTGSLPPPSGKKCAKCDQVCLLYDERGVIRPLNNIKSGNGTGYIVVLGKNFQGFLNKDISTFERKGINKKAVLLRFYDGKYQEQTDMIDICDLPRCENKNCDDGLSLGVVIAIIIGVIVGIIILYFFINRGRVEYSRNNDMKTPMGFGYNGKLKYY